MKSLQSMRFIFALMIFFHHVPDKTGVGMFSAGGSCAVSFFFILSGFILAKVYGDRVLNGDFDYSKFLVKRLSKVYPVHLLCLIVWVIFNMPVIDMNRICRLLPNVFLIQSWIPDRGLYFSGNALSWFLSDMLFFYMIFPYVILALFPGKEYGHKKNDISQKKEVLKLGDVNIPLVVFFLLLYGSVFYFINKDMIHPVLYINPFFRLYDFIIGIVLYSLYKAISDTMGSKIMQASFVLKSLVEFIVVGILFVQILFYDNVPNRIGFVCYWWLPLALLILILSLFDTYEGGIITRLIKNRFFVLGGNLSFCLYMIHILVINEVNNIECEWIYRTLISIIVTVFLATLLHYCFEKPISSLIVKKYEAKCV